MKKNELIINNNYYLWQNFQNTYNMKKSLTLIALLISLCCNAQTIETKSSCDSNADGKVTVADVTNTANKVIGKAVTEKQVVTADDLNSVLLNIYQQLLDIKQQLEDQKKLNYTLEEQLGLPHYNNGHEYVDLGLPSGLKWATMNVGATEVAGSKTNSHTGRLDCYGEYYAWGETTPKDSYIESNLKYCNKWDKENSEFTFSKYVASSDYGTIDNKTTLDLEDDAAHANWGGSWRIPTTAELKELRANCYSEWTTSYNNSGVAGYIVYKVKDDSDKCKLNSTVSSQTPTASYSLCDTHIFIPAAGRNFNSDFDYVGSRGYYWMNSLDTDGSHYAEELYFNSGNILSIASYRYFGLTIRPVCP